MATFKVSQFRGQVHVPIFLSGFFINRQRFKKNADAVVQRGVSVRGVFYQSGCLQEFKPFEVIIVCPGQMPPLLFVQQIFQFFLKKDFEIGKAVINFFLKSCESKNLQHPL